MVQSRYRFAKEIRLAVKAECKLDNWHGPFAVCHVLTLVAASIALPYLLHPFVNWWVTYALISVPTIGLWQRGMATLLHEAAHRVLAKNQYINFICGTFGSGYLIFQGFAAYKDSHLRHHLHLGDADRDPDLSYLMSQGAYRKQSRAQFIWAMLVSPLALVKTPSKIVDLFRNRFFSPNEPKKESAAKLAYLVSLASIFGVLGLTRTLLLFWIIPFLTAFPIVNWYIELLEHYPLVVTGIDDLHMTRNRWTSPLVRWATGLFNENYHLTHHLFPQCPFWKLPVVHGLLMRDHNYREAQAREIGLVIPIIDSTPSIFGNILDWVRQNLSGGEGA